jgi:ABC-type histidine transport system ATPase subunit
VAPCSWLCPAHGADLAFDFETVKKVLDTIMGLAHQVFHCVIFMADGEIPEENTPEKSFRAPRLERARNFRGETLHH